MKIRENFVSNSSSTSFIIAFKDPKPCHHCGRKDPNIIKLIEEAEVYSDSNRIEAIGIDDVKKFIDNYFDKEYKGTTEILKSVDNYKSKEDWELAAIRISNHNEEIRAIIDNGITSGSLVCLHDSEE
jgi:hypothetical protein